MSSRLDRWTPAITTALMLAALLACKRKKAEPEGAPAATATLAPPPGTQSPAATTQPTPNTPKLGDVKRYPDKEKKEDEAAVKILEDEVKVFNEADLKTAEVATLPKDLVVVRLASLEQEGFTLVDFPSGIGQFSPGWVESKFLEAKGQQVARDKVLAQEKKANIQPATKPGATTGPADAGAKDASAGPVDAGAKDASTGIVLPKPSEIEAGIGKILDTVKTALPTIDPKAAAERDKAAAKARAGSGGTKP